MVTLLWKPVAQWLRAALQQSVPQPVPALAFRRPALRPAAVRPRRAVPLTPFGARPSVAASRRFWMTLDPADRRRGAIGGSFAEVCSALERLAALEEPLSPCADRR